MVKHTETIHKKIKRIEIELKHFQGFTEKLAALSVTLQNSLNTSQIQSCLSTNRYFICHFSNDKEMV